MKHTPICNNVCYVLQGTYLEVGTIVKTFVLFPITDFRKPCWIAVEMRCHNALCLGGEWRISILVWSLIYVSWIVAFISSKNRFDIAYDTIHCHVKQRHEPSYTTMISHKSRSTVHELTFMINVWQNCRVKPFSKCQKADWRILWTFQWRYPNDLCQ